MLIDIRPRIRKPLYGVVDIDWAHPLARGLVGCWIFNSGSVTLTDQASHYNAVITDPTNITWTNGPAGYGLRSVTTAAASGITLTPVYNYTLGSMFSFDTLITPGTQVDTYGSILSFSNGIYFRATTQVFDFYTGADNVNNTAVPSGTTAHYVLAVDPLGISGTHYLNGKPDGSFVFVAMNATFQHMLNDASSRSYNGICYFQRVWNRTLTAQEAMWLAKEPYAFLKPRPAVWYSFSSASTGATASTRPPSLALTGVGI